MDAAHAAEPGVIFGLRDEWIPVGGLAGDDAATLGRRAEIDASVIREPVVIRQHARPLDVGPVGDVAEAAEQNYHGTQGVRQPGLVAA